MALETLFHHCSRCCVQHQTGCVQEPLPCPTREGVDLLVVLLLKHFLYLQEAQTVLPTALPVAAELYDCTEGSPLKVLLEAKLIG